MPKRVLSVGQCAADQWSIARFLQSRFEVSVERADTEADALDSLRRQSYDLVLVNRRLDADDADGVAIIRRIKSDADLRDVPMMLVSNYPDAQQRAVAAGAEPGFGKAQYDDPTVVERLAGRLG